MQGFSGITKRHRVIIAGRPVAIDDERPYDAPPRDGIALMDRAARIAAVLIVLVVLLLVASWVLAQELA